MKTISQIIITTGLSLSFVACAGKSDAPRSVDQSRNTVDQAKKDSEKAVENAKKSSDAAEATAMDATAKGGQPGSISLLGGAVLRDGTLDSRIIVKSSAGMGWRGVAPTLSPSAVSLRPEIAASTMMDLDKLKSDDSFINVGCEDNAISDATQHLKRSESDLSPDKLVETFRANTIFLCDANQLKGSIILIEAQTVILHSLAFSQNGFIDKMFDLTTSELVLEGNNSVSAIATDGASTLLPGPAITINAERLTGDGTLKLLAQGASFRSGQP